MILLSSSLQLDPVEIIQAYGYRFKIEFSFKQAIHVLGNYLYHFWMKDMTPVKRGGGTQYLHRKTEKYRQHVRRKMHAYHLYVLFCCIAQGLLIHLSINKKNDVWKNFNGWVRTIRPGIPPSEMIVADALRSSLPLFLQKNDKHCPLAKFINENRESGEREGTRKAA